MISRSVSCSAARWVVRTGLLGEEALELGAKLVRGRKRARPFCEQGLLPLAANELVVLPLEAGHDGRGLFSLGDLLVDLGPGHLRRGSQLLGRQQQTRRL